jgi:hypothetical protein
MYARGVYTRPPGEPFAITPTRVAFLVLVGLISATLAFLAGRSLGADTATPSSLSGANVSQRDQALSTRLAPVPRIGSLDIPKPAPAPAATTPTTTGTVPTTEQFNSAPQQSAPSPSPAPAPSPSPAPSAPSGGGGNGGSFDDSG